MEILKTVDNHNPAIIQSLEGRFARLGQLTAKYFRSVYYPM